VTTGHHKNNSVILYQAAQ